MGALYVFDHPLVQHKLAAIKTTGITTKERAALLNEVFTFMAYEATRELSSSPLTHSTSIHAPKDEHIAIIAILSAGTRMTDGMRSFMPNAKTGYIDCYRNPLSQAQECFYTLPENIDHYKIFLVDSALLTGIIATAVVDHLKEAGCTEITYLCLTAAQDAIKALQSSHPDVDVYTTAVETDRKTVWRASNIVDVRIGD